MRVSFCKKCKDYRRYKWSTYHIPAKFHAIGISHIYAFCEKEGIRCIKVKKCSCEGK